MNIINKTPYLAELYFAMDREIHDCWVVVIKGTFKAESNGDVEVSEEQVPMTYADEFFGDPAETAIRYPCDFVLRKPAADILVNGNAHAPQDKPVERLDVLLKVGSLSKRITVIGDRRWQATTLGIHASRPKPFTTMPLNFQRAFGGVDDTHESLKKRGTEERNPCGLGFRLNGDPDVINATDLPNLEYPGSPIKDWWDRPAPAGLGAVGPGWLPRRRHAGTYDQDWIDQRFPFLPPDFDERYFQCAPEDQIHPHLQGGEEVRCINMTPDGNWQFAIPHIPISSIFVFRDRHMEVVPVIDALLLEPDQYRFTLTWRATLPIPGRPHDLHQILIGSISPGMRRSLEKGKRVFASFADHVEWSRQRALSENW